MTKALTEADGPSWREKLPPIPTVPLAVREKFARQAADNASQPKAAPQQNGIKQTGKPGAETFVLFLISNKEVADRIANFVC